MPENSHRAEGHQLPESLIPGSRALGPLSEQSNLEHGNEANIN